MNLRYLMESVLIDLRDIYLILDKDLTIMNNKINRPVIEDIILTIIFFASLALIMLV